MDNITNKVIRVRTGQAISKFEQIMWGGERSNFYIYFLKYKGFYVIFLMSIL
jgi:hypothetical protein